MPFIEMDELDQRIRLVCALLDPERHRTAAAVCDAYGVVRSTGYYWLERYLQAQSFTALTNLSRAPHTQANKTPDEIEARVVALREKYGWGGEKLQVLLRREGITLSVSTVNRILRRRGLVRREEAQQPAVKRFEADAPNALWQIDFKARFPLDEGHCYPLAVLDDNSRFLLGLCALPSTAEQTTYAALESIMVVHGLPDAILMDHGTPWWNSNSPSGLTSFATKLIEQDINLYYGRFRHPQTQGKVEALNHTLARDLRHHGLPNSLASAQAHFDRFRSDYNQIRPHQMLGLGVPADYYQPSERRYQPTPVPWNYPSDYQVVRLNSQGSMDYLGIRCFVAKPLAARQVGVHEADGHLLVQYRGHYIREINLHTGESRAFDKPLHDVRMVSDMS